MFSNHMPWAGAWMLAAACAALPAAAQPAETFYAKRAMTIVSPNAAGGINDISARLVARHIIKYIPGSPSMVVQNQPGAAGIAGANLLYNSYDKDGGVIAMMERAIPQSAILGDKNVK